SPTINVSPTSGTNTRANVRFPAYRPKGFMASTSLSPLLEMEWCSITNESDLPYRSWIPRLAAGLAFPDDDLPRWIHDYQPSRPTDLAWRPAIQRKEGKSSGLYTSPFDESKNSGGTSPREIPFIRHRMGWHRSQ